jgi:hypothetical protein
MFPIVCKLFFFGIPFIKFQVVDIPKYSHEDTTFVTRNSKGESLTIPVPKGTRISIHTPGLHYNR